MYFDSLKELCEYIILVTIRLTRLSEIPLQIKMFWLKRNFRSVGDPRNFKERGVFLEVESVSYIEMHRGPATYLLGPPPSRCGDLELESHRHRQDCMKDHVLELLSTLSPLTQAVLLVISIHLTSHGLLS